jgi:hypothetical protein
MSMLDDMKHKAEQVSDTAKEKYHEATDAFEEKKQELEDKRDEAEERKGGRIDREANEGPENDDLLENDEDFTLGNRPGTVDTDRDDITEEGY